MDNLIQYARRFRVTWGVLCLVFAACADQAGLPPDARHSDAAVIVALAAILDSVPAATVATDLRTALPEEGRADRVAAALGLVQRERDGVVVCARDPAGCTLEGADAFVSIEQSSIGVETASVVIAMIVRSGGPRQHLDEVAYRVDLRLVDGAWKVTGTPQIVGHVKMGWS